MVVLLPPPQGCDVGEGAESARTGSVPGEPSFATGLAEEMLAFSPCRPPASRTESMSGVAAPTGRRSCEGESATFSVGGLGFSSKPTGGLSRTDGVRRRWDRRSVVGAPGSRTAQAAKGNMLGLTECCSWSRAGIFTSGVGRGCENNATNGVSLCPLSSGGVSASAMLYKVGPRGPT